MSLKRQTSIVFHETIKSGVIISIVTAISVIIGFVSSFAESRVLGLPFENTNAATYLLQTGKMILQTLQSLQSIFETKWPLEYLLSYKWWGIIVCGICVALAVVRGRYLNIIPDWLRKILQRILSGLGLGIVCLSIGSIMTDYYMVRNVLQHNSMFGWEMHEYISHSFHNGHDLDARDAYNTEIVSEYYKSYMDDFPERLFNPLTENNQQLRKGTYLVVVVLLTLFYVFTLLLTFKKWLRYTIFAFACTALSYVHGVVGTSYTFPVVTVYYTHGEAIVRQRNGLLLLREGTEYQILIDRGDFMKIYRIPKNAILSIEQKGKIDLFQNCAKRNGEVVLCESTFW